MAKYKSGGMHIDPKNRGKFTRAAGGKSKIGAKIKSVLKKGSKASGTLKKEANFARMARRHFMPLSQGGKS